MAVVAAGLSPNVGFMHAPGVGRSALVLDLMEPLRPVADAVVLGLAASETFTPVDFVLRDDGVCRLAPQLARTVSNRVAAGVSEQYLSSIIARLIGDFLLPRQRRR